MCEGLGGGREAGHVGGAQDKGIGHPRYQVIGNIGGLVAGNGLGRKESAPSMCGETQASRPPTTVEVMVPLSS